MRTLLDNASKFLRLLGKRRSPYPEEIQIEVTNACNLKCAMCPHTHGLIPQVDFPFERFEDLIRNNPAPRRLILTGWGEPLLHKRFFDMIALAHQHWPRTLVRFTTNGILLDESRRSQIASSRIAGITVSVDLWPERDSIPPEWREILHPPSPKTLRNLIAYSEDTRVSRQTPLVLQSLLVPENVSDIQNYIQFAAERSLQAVNLVRMQSYPENPVSRMTWEQEQNTIAELMRWGKTRGVPVRSVNRQPWVLRLATHFDRLCLRTDDSLYITVDGIVTPCCNIRNYAIGSTSPSGIDVKAAWNSDSELAFFADQSPVCGKCDALFHTYRT